MLVSLFTIFSLSAIAAPIGCHPYQSPIASTIPYLQQVVYFDNNPPMCADDFIASLKSDTSNASRNALIEKVIRTARKNVRTLYCDAGKMNVVFLNKKVFLTNAHAFYFLDDRELPTKPFSINDVHHCYVMTHGKKDYVDVDARTYPDTGDPRKNASLDYGVGAVEDTIDDVEPIKIANPKDYSQGQDIIVASAYRGNNVGRNCFSVAHCYERKSWMAVQDLASLHLTNCPSDQGASGSAEFLISQSNEIVLGHIYSSGTYAADSNGKPYPNGRAFFYTKDFSDPRAAFSASIGIDGVYRQKIDAFVKRIEERNPPGSLEPDSHAQDAEYVPKGQSL